MSTLITGAGLVGARAVELALEHDPQVAVFDVSPDPRLLASVADRVSIIRGDLTYLPEVLAAVKQCQPDRILHTAGVLTPAGQERPYATIQINLAGTVNLLEAARLEGVRRVAYCSSATVYDALAPVGPTLAEDHPARPATLYSATKLSGEYLGEMYAERFGFEFVTVRFAAVYGPAFNPGGGVSRVIQDALLAGLRTRQAEVRRRWQGGQDLLHARDAAAGLVAAAFRENLAHSVYNIGSGQSSTVDDVAGLVARLTGAEVRISDPQGLAQVNPRPRLEAPFDLRRARDELGYAPGYDLAGGMEQMVAWMRQHLLSPASP